MPDASLAVDPLVPARSVELVLGCWELQGGTRTELLQQFGLTKLPDAMPWSLYCAMSHAVAARANGPADLQALGHASIRNAEVRVFHGLFRGLASPATVYRLLFTWLAPRFNPVIGCRYQAFPDGRCVLDIDWPPPLAPNPLLGWATAGFIQGLPSVFGLPDARVEATAHPHGARITFWPPPHASLFGRLKGLFSTSTADQTLLHELRRQHSELQAQVHAATLARKKAEAAEDVQSEFLAALSDEVKVAVAGLAGLSTKLLCSPLPPEEQESAALVARSAASLHNLFQDILTLAQIEQRTLHLPLTPQAAQPLLADAIAAFQPAAEERRLALVWEDSAPDARAALNRDAWLRSLHHLLDNAVRFTLQGAITVQSRVVNGVYEVSIQDTGPGIPAALRPHLFEPFRQLDGSMTRRVGGAGLGLAISAHLLQQQRATLNLHSTPNVGTCVLIRVPAL